MRSRGVAPLLLAFVVIALTPGANAASETPVVISGTGAAHGFGMAMDGVENQARAGWSRDRILDLFYPGTSTGQAGGTIRVGLEESEASVVSLPNGGTISDAPQGAGGWAVNLAPNTTVKLASAAGGVAIVEGVPRPEAAPASGAAPAAAHPDSGTGGTVTPAQAGPPIELPTPPPEDDDPGGDGLLDPTPAPTPKPKPGTPAPTTAPAAPSLTKPRVFLWGAGDPGLVAVASTGRRYRGSMEVKPHPATAGKLVVVNHVGLETYVAGIAEEKGQAWPQAALEALAVAARTLGAATMGWYDKNQANGFDICPTANCQLYLGYDGEAPDMARATAATAGVIRTYNGRPIMAMYHGNGGGQTESYKRVIDNGTDPHPYLASVRYPMAAPSHWNQRTTVGSIEVSLRTANIAVPGTIERIGVVERGESPRVLRVRIEASGGTLDVGGVAFAGALGLRSTWFDLGSRDRNVTKVRNSVDDVPLFGATAALPVTPIGRAGSSRPGLTVFAIASAALASAFLLRRLEEDAAA